MFLSSGASRQYEGAMFSYKGDFLNYLGLKDMGVYTAPGGVSSRQLNEIEEFGRMLK